MLPNHILIATHAVFQIWVCGVQGFQSIVLLSCHEATFTYCFPQMVWSSLMAEIFFFSHPHTVHSIWFKTRNCFQYRLTISITLFPYRMFSFLYMLMTDEVYNYVGGRQSITIFKGRYIYWVIGCRRSNHLFRSSRRRVSTKLTKILINKP